MLRVKARDEHTRYYFRTFSAGKETLYRDAAPKPNCMLRLPSAGADIHEQVAANLCSLVRLMNSLKSDSF